MIIHVVMGNDFPDAVFSSETLAEEYCERRRVDDRREGRRIYWRVNSFEVDAETRASASG